jgi:hypothetical protein
MIIANVIGGLGNQMFQYAFGRALSLRHGVPLKLDLHEFCGYTLHAGFMLHKVFGIPVEKAKSKDRRSVLGWRAYRPALKILRRRHFERWRGDRLLVQDLSVPASHYVSKASADSYLLGYWQSEGYFAAIGDQLRRDFRFPQLAGENQAWARRIVDANAVSVHIRRGDYVSDSQTLATHGVCSLDYYREAMAFVAERVPGAEFFLFSDDLEWARKTLKISHRHHFVLGNRPAGAHHDMHLISLCRHHIIANSSFSWWGAWLCDHAEKVVVAPSRWLAQIAMPEVVPQSWTRL